MDDWVLSYNAYRPELEGLREALCTLGNGYVATRGAAPDCGADAVHYPGTYLAGGYNRLTTTIAGRDVENEDLVNLPNWLPLTVRIDDGAWMRLDTVELVAYRQELDLRQGVLRRTVRFRDPQGRVTRWQERRLVSMAQPHLAGLAVEVTPENWSGRLTVRSALDGSVTNQGVPRYRALASRHLETLEVGQPDAETLLLRSRTTQSLLHVVEAARTRLYHQTHLVNAERQLDRQTDVIAHELACPMQPGASITVEKIVALYTSRDPAIAEPGLEATQTLREAGRFDDLLAAHTLAWAHLWEAFDFAIEETPPAGTALKLRVYIFHLLQTVSPHTIELDIGVPARGWHGEAYRGHIFWDELFILPFLTLRLPMLTRALLRYRYRRLPEARRAAQAAGYAGAMYPWQSGSNGREETQTLHLNPHSGRWIPDHTHRQRHINVAIAYNIWQYYQITDDHEFLYFYGAEMLLEIARFWASIATYNPSIDRYEITGVMGPDEYHTAYPGADPAAAGGIHNNAYTNVMVAWVLERARDVLALLPPAHCRQLCERLGLTEADLAQWDELSRTLRVPLHGDGIISQFDGYGDLEAFDWPGYQERYGNIQRLDRILEAEHDTTNRYQVSKQADVLMLFYLLSADELALLFEQLGYPFERATIPQTIAYYLARTSHGSTLSRVVHAWVLARADRPRSWELFQGALDSDIADIQGGTTREGIHVGAMAGTIDLIQRCYLGLELRANVLYFDPVLPDELTRVKVHVRYRRQVLAVEVTHEVLRISSRSFTVAPITIAYRGHFRDVAPGDTCEFRLLTPQERHRDENRPAGVPRERGSLHG